MARSPFSQHAVTGAQHVHRVHGSDDFPVQRQLVGRRVLVTVTDAATAVVDEHERQRQRQQTQTDSHHVRGYEAQIDHYVPVDEHAQYAAQRYDAADSAELDRPPFLGRGVGHVRIDAIEQHRRPARECYCDRLPCGRYRGRHGPLDRAVQRHGVRHYLADDGQQDQRPATSAVPVAPRACYRGQQDGHQLLD